MLASVVIPCWNVERWLERCLDEVMPVLPPDCEAIAVDDGSTDSTLQILRRRAAADSRLRVVQSAHRGVSAARNLALDAACGEYLFFVDPDDGVEPDFFSAMLAAAKNADYCLCAFRFREGDVFRDSRLKGDYRYGSNEEIVREYLPRIFGYSFDDVRRWYGGESLFSRRELAGVTRGCFRRGLIERFGIRFDENIELFEDAMFNAEYLLHAQSMACVDRALYRCTVRDSGAMRTVPRDPLRFCRNKLALLRRREAIDSGGGLAGVYAASCVFSLLEVVLATAKGGLPLREGRRIAGEMLADGRVRAALKGFPLSVRRPLLAAAVWVLRTFFA